jgi:hypothetical protein
VDGYRVYLKAIRRASEIVGGAHPLAARLEVDPGEIETWLAGGAAPDDVMFLRAVDIIVAHDRIVPWTQAELEADLAARRAAR